MTNSARFLIALKSLAQIGPKRARKILEILLKQGSKDIIAKKNSPSYPEIEDIEQALFLAREGGVEVGVPKLKLRSYETTEIEQAIDFAQKLEKKSDAANVKVISIFDDNYPSKLHRLKDPPALLNYIGDDTSLQQKTCAVIGTRNPTEHGRKKGEEIAKKLSEHNIVVVSGLALGCDTAGHWGCIKGGGKTVAVLAQGLVMEKLYPASNQDLATKIIESGGLLLSEYTIDTELARYHFVERDRICAGLSDFLFVVETPKEKSGTWHTINFAIESEIPIATYNHPEKLRGMEQALGNQKLTNDRKATGIATHIELKLFLKNLYAAV